MRGPPRPEACPLCHEPIKENDACYTAHRLGVVHYDCHKEEIRKRRERIGADLKTIFGFVNAHGREDDHGTILALAALTRIVVDLSEVAR